MVAIPAAIYRSAFRARAGEVPPPGVLFGQFWAPASECPKECFLSAFWRFLGPKNAKKHSKSTLWGTPRQVPKPAQKALRGALSGPGPKSTPVNGGRDRNHNLGGNFGPEKKYLAPPPPQIPKFPSNTLPAPPPPTRRGDPPPLLGFSMKNLPPPLRPLGLPFPTPPSRKK